MTAVDKAALLASRGLGTQTVSIDGIGDVVVRGLTRAEALSIQQRGDLDAADMEALLLSLALVEPALSLDEVKQWQAIAPAGELEPISSAVQGLSGLRAVEVKDQMQRFRG